MGIDYLDNTCIEMIAKAMTEHDFAEQNLLDWLEENDVRHKRNPSAWFSKVFWKEFNLGTFFRPIKHGQYQEPNAAQQPIAISDDEPALIIKQEIKSEKRDKREWEQISENIAYFSKEDPDPPVEPNSDRIAHIKDERYRENTWISVYREAQEEKTSMHEICRRKGLVYSQLIY